MESHLHHPTQSVWANCNVLWVMWIPSDIPGLHELQFCQLHLRQMAHNLHGWPSYWCWLLRGWRRESTPYPTTVLRSQIISKAIKMWVWKIRDWVPWYDNWKWLYLYRPCQTICHCDLASFENSKSSPLLLRFCNFYHKFIPSFSNTIAPLIALTHKNQPWCWDPVHQTAFDTLYYAVCIIRSLAVHTQV